MLVGLAFLVFDEGAPVDFNVVFGAAVIPVAWVRSLNNRFLQQLSGQVSGNIEVVGHLDVDVGR